MPSGSIWVPVHQLMQFGKFRKIGALIGVCTNMWVILPENCKPVILENAVLEGCRLLYATLYFFGIFMWVE